MKAAWLRWRERLGSPPKDPGWIPLRRNGPTLRRWLSAGAVAAAAAVGLGMVAPNPPVGEPVVVAARDVPAGAALQRDDLRIEHRAASELPTTATHRLSTLIGRSVASPLSAREVVTTSRLLGSGLLAGLPDRDVAVPVRLADGETARLLHPGARVDVLVSVEGAASARTVARGATVLAGAPPSGSQGGLLGGVDEPGHGGLILLAVAATVAADLTQAASAGALSILLR